MHAALVYPHQLFPQHPAVASASDVYLIEDPLFFSQYPFHRQKLMLHRASMKQYAVALRRKNVHYIEAHQLKVTGALADILVKDGITHVQFTQLNDDWLHQRVATALTRARLPFDILPDPHFLTTDEIFQQFAGSKKKLFFTEFYIQQRQRLGIMVDGNGKPYGEQWSFDPDNRKKLPRDVVIPKVDFPAEDACNREARQYVARQFPNAPGTDKPCLYPTNRSAAKAWLTSFIQHRFRFFGDYEDAMHSTESILFHSVLTPMLNIGLLSPLEVVEAALAAAETVPLNSLEGFIRQIIGWREFIRGTYHHIGRRQRSRNYWNHTRPMPKAFYDGTSGIEPIDNVIRHILDTGYCHHIERLMLLGNIFCLCEIDPDAVYQWFMEFFIDAYDWVMVPNVYGMSQHADGGLMTTKPYLSGSSYVLKMSNYRKGSWCPIWDGLYWRFIDKHRDFFRRNPRLSMMSSQLDRMGSKLDQHKKHADDFLAKLW